MEEKREQLRLTKIRSKLQKNYIGMNITDFFQKISLRNEAVERKLHMSEEEQIEEILEEANAYNLRNEVKEAAEKILKENDMFSKLDAYVSAYHQVIDD